MTDRDVRRDGMENRVRGNAEELKGKVRGDAGDALDSREHHVEGRFEQASRKVRKGIAKVQQELGTNDDVDRESRR
jgi:uncharacterized protein YjbJ (UPF0337 family)